MTSKTPKAPPPPERRASQGQLVDVIVRTPTGGDFYPGAIFAIGVVWKRRRLCIVVDPEVDPKNPPELDLNSYIELIAHLR